MTESSELPRSSDPQDNTKSLIGPCCSHALLSIPRGGDNRSLVQDTNICVGGLLWGWMQGKVGRQKIDAYLADCCVNLSWALTLTRSCIRRSFSLITSSLGGLLVRLEGPACGSLNRLAMNLRIYCVSLTGGLALFEALLVLTWSFVKCRSPRCVFGPV
jgi:hypothetical protein